MEIQSIRTAGFAWSVLVVSLTSGDEVRFNRDIRPIFSDACYTCHGPDAQQRVGEFRMDRSESVFGGVDGGVAVVKGKPAQSVLLDRISSTDPFYRMPPPDSGITLSENQINHIQNWIAEGATWAGHWAFTPPSAVTLPQVKNPAWPKNPIDRFTLAKMAEHGLQPAPIARRETLIRRATLDLTGLPPTPEEVADFLNDTSPRAWNRIIDRLLQSPRFGERMASDWLDVARYADTSGYQNDGPRDMWRWRDWVIDAINDNMPYDQFTIEQLAGDLLPNPSLAQRIATGFNRNHRGNAEGGIIPEEYQVEYVVDRVDTTSTVWLGLTIGCARCHDHKYDPISQEDFYRLFAYFNNIPENGRAIKEGNSPPYIKAPTAAAAERLRELDATVRRAKARHERLQGPMQSELRAWLASAVDNARLDWTPTDGLVHQCTFDSNDDFGAEPTSSEEPPAAQVEGVRGDAAEFRGCGAIESGDVANFGYFDKFSISAWIFPDQLTGTIVSRMIPIEQGSGYSIDLTDGKLQINLVKRWLDDSIRVSSAERIAAGRWHHIAVSYDGSRRASGIRLFIDGGSSELVVDYDGINQTFAVDQPLRIGDGGHRFFGRIDDVHIYDRVLTRDDVAALSVAESIDQLRAIKFAGLTRSQRKKIEGYFVRQQASDPIRHAHITYVQSQRQRDRFEQSIPTVMVMQEMPVPRATHVLQRGRYDAPGQRVEPGTPEILSKASPVAGNRLSLARWITDPENPLTARVAVNRIWQSVFGTGIVKTTEDFGAQGDAPSHPMLLDYLAIRLVQTGWDVKAMYRLILSSATYQQDSRFTERRRQLDPENRWLSRGPRIRWPAEVVRDQALAASGLLVETVGGPSVRPYQPDGLWKEIASTTQYDQSHGRDLYRRSLYTYWKRTVAPPTMVTLDATGREACTVKRSRTNTPMQALVLMNEVSFVESARALAQRVLQQHGINDSARIVLAFRLVTARAPRQEEAHVLHQSLARHMQVFADAPDDAQRLLQVGEMPVPTDIKPQRLAAWTMVMSLIINLDEVVNKE